MSDSPEKESIEASLELHEAMVAKARTLFPCSEIIHVENYDVAKKRMMGWIRSLKPYLRNAVARWALACEGATDCSINCEEPHRSWAARLLREDLTDMLTKLHEAGHALSFTSTDPATWTDHNCYNCSHNMTTGEAIVHLAGLEPYLN